jgi:hypothetical protein
MARAPPPAGAPRRDDALRASFAPSEYDQQFEDAASLDGDPDDFDVSTIPGSPTSPRDALQRPGSSG